MVAGSVIYQPEVNVSILEAQQPVANAAQRVLLVGQTAGGSATNGQWVRDIGNANEEVALFGRDSMLAEMVRTFKRYAPQVSLDAIALTDHASGVARIVTITITGTSSAAGTIILRVGSSRRVFTVSIPSGSAAATVCGLLADALNADPELPFTASVVTTTLTLTAVNDGTVANGLAVELSGAVVGLTIGSVTQAIPGSQDPTLSNVFDVIGSTRYQGIAWPYSAATEELTELLDARWNANGIVNDGVGFSAVSDTLGNIVTLLINAEKNSLSLVMICDEQQAEAGYLGPATGEPPYVLAAAAVAIRAARLTDGASISRFVASSGALDQRGGTHTASLPYHNTLLPELSVPRNGRGWTDLEIAQLVALGGTVFGQNVAGSGLIFGSVVTTYLTNGAGVPDVTWHFLNQVDTFSAVREYFQSNLRATFAQSRLTLGEAIVGYDMANEEVIRGVMKRLYSNLSRRGFALLAAGEEALGFFEDNLAISIDLAAGRATVTCKAIPVGQLRILDVTVQVAFSTAG